MSGQRWHVRWPLIVASCLLLGLLPALTNESAQAASGPSWHVDTGLPSAGLTLSTFACAPDGRCVGLGSLGGNEIAVTLRSGEVESWSDVTSRSYPTGALSCATSTVCEGVGKSSGDSAPILRSTNAGRSWTQQINVAGLVGGIACPTATRCMASDFREGHSSFINLDFTTSDGGSTWQHHTIRNGNVGFGSVLCPSASVCYVSPGNLGIGMDILITKNFGSTWTKLAVPWPSGAELTAFSCASVTSCAALITGVQSRSITTESVIWFNREGASFSTSKATSGNVVQEFGFSCGTALVCHIDVYRLPDAGGALTFEDLETTDSGKEWMKTQVPSTIVALGNITCQGATSCLAIGVRKDSKRDSFVRFTST